MWHVMINENFYSAANAFSNPTFKDTAMSTPAATLPPFHLAFPVHDIAAARQFSLFAR
jgi:hypothetical protein